VCFLIAVAAHVLGLGVAGRWWWAGWQLAATREDPPPQPVEEVDVAWVELPEENPDVDLPDPVEQARLPKVERPEPEPAPRVPPRLEPPRSIKEIPPEVAALPPKPPLTKDEEPEAPKPEEVAALPAPMTIPRLEKHRMVEVDDDEHVVDEPNLEAQYWSDKNRRVTDETHDTRTNLEKTSKGDASASAENPDQESVMVGGDEQKIAALEERRATSLSAKAREPEPKPEPGDGGEEGEDGREGQGGRPGKLAELRMRDRDAAPKDGVGKVPRGEPVGKAGKPGKAGKLGKKGRRGPKLRLEQDDYQRIVGSEQAEVKDQELARRKASHHKGRWEQKLARIHSALENFTPEVRPGNQTALGTRAHPFAIYVARMHRRIHELWAFGFIDALNAKASANPLNDPMLAVTMEIVLGPEGTVDKVTIVRPSGLLTFDVAAVDTVLSAGPYEAPPRDIRSADGKVYTHWTFHRDDRLCGTYFADPFILDNPRPEADHHAVSGLEENIARQKQGRRAPPSRLSREEGSATDGEHLVPHAVRAETGDPAAAARVNKNLPTPDAPGANDVARRFVVAFEKGDPKAVSRLAGTPFRAAGSVVAEDPAGLATVFRTLLGELGARKVVEWKLFSAAGYRGAFGHLPPGAQDGTATLFLVVRTRSDELTFEVGQVEEEYRIVGVYR
jgi:hypothetical protein